MTSTLSIVDDRERIIVDDDVAELISKYDWRIKARYKIGNPRPYTFIPRRDRSKWPKTVFLARLVADAKEGQFVQHLNGNTLDCRRENLRFVATRNEAGRNNRPTYRTTDLFGRWW